MNWGNLQRTATRGGKRGPGAGARDAGETPAKGMGAAWKEVSLSKEGDQLQCRHFSACSGCEFDRSFDATPVMVDSR